MSQNNNSMWTISLIGLVLCLALNSFSQTMTPAQWLANRPKPVFAPGHRLPPLTKYGWPLPWDLTVETATNWGYALDTSSHDDLLNGNVTNVLADRSRILTKAVTLATNYPGKFVLSFNLERSWPTNLSNGFWSTNAAGWFVDAKSNTWQYRTNQNFTPVVSPEAPDIDLTNQANSIVASLIRLNALTPVGIVLNGGERDLGVVGFDRSAWNLDARVQRQAVFTNAYANPANVSGMSWPRYISNQKARHLRVLTGAVRSAVPNLKLHIWYNTGLEQARFHQPGYDWTNEWANWGWLSDVLNEAVGTPNFENYYVNPSSWTNAPGAKWNTITDLLTKHLNAVGYNMRLGYPTNYSWVCAGWSNTDTNRLSDISRYTGFLKCLYTSGMIGANAGYYEFPVSQSKSPLFGGPGFDASFPSNSPPHWLLQIEALARVHAQFSHLENYIWNGRLLEGNNPHVMSLDQPSYEFTNTVADATVRVLVRKLNASDEWLITAWASAGSDRAVTVNVPTLGQVSILASAAGSVYRATPTTLTRLNELGLSALAPPTGLHASGTKSP